MTIPTSLTTSATGTDRRGRRPASVRGRSRLLSVRGPLALLALSGAATLRAQEPAAPAPPAAPAEDLLNADQLQSLVAPIALYPDALLAQTLVASTYPLEMIQLQQWLAKHPDLKDEALADSVATQPWDPSVQSMAAVPEVVKRLADDIQWTTELGNAFLAQQADVMDAVQAMRQKAQAKGALESNAQQRVDTVIVEQKTVIVVESTDPEVIYVPSYSPTVVYPPPVYPYPPIYYPPYPPGAAFVTFSVGVAVGAAYWGGSCCHAGWGHNNTVIINNNNNFNQINNINRGQGNGTWQHNPSHRGGAPYGDQRTASQYGGATRGQGGTPAASTRAAGGAGASPSAAGAAGSRGAESIGNRSVPSGARSGGFSGGSSGYSGSTARASSSRGASSMGSARGGGASRGGGRRR